MGRAEHIAGDDGPPAGPAARARLGWIGLLVFALALGAVWYWQSLPTPSAIAWLRDPREAFARAEAEGKPVLVDFYLHGCPPCAAMDREVFSDPQVGRWVNGVCVPLSLDLQQERDLSSRYGVRAAPTLLVVRPDGEPLVGPANPDAPDRRGWFDGFLRSGLARWQELRPATAESAEPHGQP